MLAGRASLRELATQTGRSYPYLVGVPNPREPLLDSDTNGLS